MDSATLKKKYKEFQDQYTNRVSGQQDFQNELEKIYGERTNYNKDLIDQKNQLQSQIYAKPSAERANLAGSALLDPLRQEALIRGDVANLQGSLGSSVDLLNARGQKWSDILAKAMGGYNARNEGLRLSAASAWQEYQDQLAQEEAARSRAAAAAQQQSIIDMLNAQNQNQNTGGGIEQTAPKPMTIGDEIVNSPTLNQYRGYDSQLFPGIGRTVENLATGVLDPVNSYNTARKKYASGGLFTNLLGNARANLDLLFGKR